MTDARGRADVNDLGRIVQQEFNVIHEPQEWRREFDVEIRVVVRDDARARLIRHESDQSLKGVTRRVREFQRLNPMDGIALVRTDAIGGGWTRREPAIIPSLDFVGRPEHERSSHDDRRQNQQRDGDRRLAPRSRDWWEMSRLKRRLGSEVCGFVAIRITRAGGVRHGCFAKARLIAASMNR